MSLTDSYISYQNMVNSVSAGIGGVGEVCETLPLADHAKALRETGEKMKNHVFSVGFMGEFKRGKSTVINALLGRKIVPADVLPCTATLNYVRWDAAPHAQICFKDGAVKDVPVEELTQYITKITTESEETAATVDSSRIYYPCGYCQNGVEIVDTPGLNDDERMTDISEQVIPSLDAIVMVIVPGAPFSQSEADFVRSKVMTSDLGRIIFLVNKIDEVEEEDRERVLDSIRAKIEASVISKIESMYGRDSREYTDARNKIGDIRLYGVSARQALKAKMKNDEALLRESGFLRFEEALAHLLTEERGLLELINPVNSVCSIAMEAKKAISMRREAACMDQDEFERVQTQALTRIGESREAERRKVEEIKDHASALYAELLPDITGYYDAIEEEMVSEAAAIDMQSLIRHAGAQDADGDPETWEGAVRALDRSMQTKLSEAAEKMTVAIRNRIGEEIVDLQDFAASFGQDLEEISSLTGAPAGKDKADMIGVALEIGTNMIFADWIFGLGGAVAGWKANGLPGALVGGGAGALASFGTAVLLAAGLGLGGLPLIVAAGLSGTYGGKLAVNLAFKRRIRERQAKEAQETLISNIHASVAAMRKNQILEKWFKDAANDAYGKLCGMLQKKLEASLSGMEETLTRIRVEMAKTAAEKENYLKEMENLDEKLDQVLAGILPVKQRLNDTLNRRAEHDA